MCSQSRLPLPDTPPLPLDAPETPPAPPTPPTPPPPPLDLHVLVAFAAQHLSKSSGTPETTNYGKHYVPPYDKPRVLDAIAALCVTSEHPQPVAAALTIDPEGHQVRLLISQAGVDRIDERLLGHIDKTWGLLRTLSEHYQTQGPVTWGRHSQKPEEMSPVAPLFRYVYEFHHAEVLRTFREWWPKLDAADRQLGRSRRYEDIRRPKEGLMGYFNYVALALRNAVRTMGDDLLILSDKRWRHLLHMLDFAAYYTRPLLREWRECQDWGLSFKGVYPLPSSSTHQLTPQQTAATPARPPRTPPSRTSRHYKPTSARSPPSPPSRTRSKSSPTPSTPPSSRVSRGPRPSPPTGLQPSPATSPTHTNDAPSPPGPSQKQPSSQKPTPRPTPPPPPSPPHRTQNAPSSHTSTRSAPRRSATSASRTPRAQRARSGSTHTAPAPAPAGTSTGRRYTRGAGRGRCRRARRRRRRRRW